MKQRAFFIFIALLVFGAGIIWYGMHQQKNVARIAEPIPPQTHYELYTEKDNGKQVSVNKNTVVIIKLKKADYKLLQVTDDTHQTVELKTEDIADSFATTFTVNDAGEYRVQAQASSTLVTDFLLTLKQVQ
jgi:hypothetical protein